MDTPGRSQAGLALMPTAVVRGSRSPPGTTLSGPVYDQTKWHTTELGVPQTGFSGQRRPRGCHVWVTLALPGPCGLGLVSLVPGLLNTAGPPPAGEETESRAFFQDVPAEGTRRARNTSQRAPVPSDPLLSSPGGSEARPGLAQVWKLHQMNDLARVTMWSTPHAMSTGSPGSVTCKTGPSTL